MSSSSGVTRQQASAPLIGMLRRARREASFSLKLEGQDWQCLFHAFRLGVGQITHALPLDAGRHGKYTASPVPLTLKRMVCLPSTFGKAWLFRGMSRVRSTRDIPSSGWEAYYMLYTSLFCTSLSSFLFSSPFFLY